MEPIETPNNGGIKLPDSVYNKMKWFVLIVLPAFSTAYLTLDAVVGVPAEEQVVGVSAVIATFVGTILGISTRNYNRSDERFVGETYIGYTEDDVPKRVFNVTNYDSTVFEGKKEVAFKVLE